VEDAARDKRLELRVEADTALVGLFAVRGERVCERESEPAAERDAVLPSVAQRFTEAISRAFR
jgi:hypothetical protein